MLQTAHFCSQLPSAPDAPPPPLRLLQQVYKQVFPFYSHDQFERELQRLQVRALVVTIVHWLTQCTGSTSRNAANHCRAGCLSCHGQCKSHVNPRHTSHVTQAAADVKAKAAADLRMRQLQHTLMQRAESVSAKSQTANRKPQAAICKPQVARCIPHSQTVAQRQKKIGALAERVKNAS